jgi:hypothetical protein
MLGWWHPPVASGGCLGTGAEQRLARCRTRRTNPRSRDDDDRYHGAESRAEPDASTGGHCGEPEPCAKRGARRSWFARHTTNGYLRPDPVERESRIDTDTLPIANESHGDAAAEWPIANEPGGHADTV